LHASGVAGPLGAAALIFAFIQTRPLPHASAAAARLVLAAETFDWDRYHDRQDACREADRIAAACARDHCDELALRQARRACSAFGPLGERR
jgi:hypothetical protein